MPNHFEASRYTAKIKQVAKEALEECASKLGEALTLAETGDGKMSGTERLFDEAFQNAANRQKVFYKKEATTTEMGVPERVLLASKGTTRGKIDCVLKFQGHLIGFEHKVVRMPRVKNVLYDIWQIEADHYRMEWASKLSGGYCTVVLYGPLVRDAGSPETVYKHFLNAMFVDYSTSIKWGQLGDTKRGLKHMDPLKWMLGSTKRLGFDLPYGADRPLDFCVRTKDRTLALVGLWAERRGRLPSVSD
ncbi:hypothetical protein [Mesorhizobium sp. M0030]|uniref:hypothetical protein n=1 Tax=Mesorhizobium sp. M0030 TaxID=2956851 RepID=UPI003336A5C8